MEAGAYGLCARGIMVVVLVCGLVAPARAEAEMAVLDLSPPGADARDARVRVDDSGAATVVWWRSSIIQARRIAPG